MASIFAKLKWAGVNCEMSPEWLKNQCWEARTKCFEHQIYVFGKQSYNLFRLYEKVDCVVTDSPLLLSLIYGKNETSDTFKKLVLEEFNKYNNFNIFVRRKKKYNPSGRFQTEMEALDKDKEVLDMLVENNIPFEVYDGEEFSATLITKLITDKLDMMK